MQRMELGAPDASGRRRPVPVEGSDFEMPCDTVVFATGQVAEGSLVEGIGVDDDALGTDEPGLYVCGDYREDASIQGAMVSGRRAADLVVSDLRHEGATDG